MLKRLGRTRLVQTIIGSGLAFALKFVWWTSRYIREPADLYGVLDPHMPIIVTFGHGQHFMFPSARRPDLDIRVLISRHGDGEINAIAARKIGMGVVRGSGSHKGKSKGGASGFLAMLKLLEEGVSVSMTADVPKRGRVAGDGIVLLAKHSGRSFRSASRPARASISTPGTRPASTCRSAGRCSLPASRSMSRPTPTTR